jgi:hypothetical protein
MNVTSRAFSTSRFASCATGSSRPPRVQAAFAESSRGEIEDYEAVLYSIARASALEQVRGRRRLAGSRQADREGLDFTQLDARRLSEPSAVVFDRELVELVWDSAAALSPDDYSLLDLNVRRGLGAGELADHVALSGDTLQTRLSRLRDSFEDAVGSTLLATRGRRVCGRLDAFLSKLDVEAGTPEFRRAVQQHVRGCVQCQETRRRFVSATEIFGSFVPMVPARGVRERIWEQLERDAKAHRQGRRRPRIFFWR